ncbi:MAG: DNA polymerase III subunit gamma/tau [Candidatus Doudnabacteria bacterium]|nr:DNA polymerase III subunit gamma/tau [Candidatus Doudnabacteria bacterium]
MNQVFYRQYRPQTFAEVVNQEPIKITLQNAVRDGSVAHAYLFCGPRGVGKTSMARILAKAVNCDKPKKGEPCDGCNACEAIRGGKFLDLIEIDAASHTGVDNIREVIEHVKFSPSQGKFKVIVIDEVHMLSKGAFNALLKTLEEPPSHALFVLATTELTKVPATIVSRTQRFDFKRLSQADIAEKLIGVARDNKLQVDDAVMKLVARAAEGSLRDALSMLDQLSSFGKADLTLEQAEELLGQTSLRLLQEFFDQVFSGDAGSAIRFLKKIVSAGRDITQFTNGFLEYLDTVLGYASSGPQAPSMLVNEDRLLLEKHGRVPRERLVSLIDLVLAAAQRIRSSPLPELPLELAVVQFVEEEQTSDSQAGFAGKADSKIFKSHQTKKSDVEPAVGSILSSGDSPPNRFYEETHSNWNKFLEHVKSYNHSLISSLRLAKVVACDSSKLTLSFPYRFHQETVEQRKNKIVIEKALEEIFARPLRLESRLASDLADEPAASDKPKRKGKLVEEALKVFGVGSSNSPLPPR